jgi:hypothetical protein
MEDATWLEQRTSSKSAVNGPELPFVSATVRCGAARQTSHSLQVQKLSWPNSHSSDKVPNNSDQPTSAFLLKPSI